MQLLTFSLNGINYGIPIKDVESIESRVDIVNIPTAPPYIRGIIKLHGTIVPVFNLASRFGVESASVENLVIASSDGMKIGLEVEKVKEIVEVENKSVLPMPVIMNGGQNCFSDVAARQKELIAMLDVGSLISLEEKEKIRQIIRENSNENKA